MRIGNRFLCVHWSAIIRWSGRGEALVGNVDMSVDTYGVATLTLDFPEKRNALSRDMVNELEHRLHQASNRDAGIKAMVVRSAYSKFFSAGGDVREWISYDAKQAYEAAHYGARVFEQLENLPILTIAAIGGSCLGGGCELALSCDLRFATEDATFGQPEVLLGNGPSWGGYYRLVRTIGVVRAKELVLLGETYSAHEAQTFGLVQRVYSTWDELLQSVQKTLRQAANNAETVAVSKLLLNEIANDMVPTRFVVDAHSAAYFVTTDVSKTRKQAFLEKRLNQLLETGDE